MKGIILAGGSGTRLYPATKVLSKQLLPIYDKPMIYYPLSTLMLSGIRDILIISTPDDIPRFRKLFGNGKQYGLNLSYKIQPNPEGLAQAFILGEDFIKKESVALILGDNIFFGHGLSAILEATNKNGAKATIFGYHVTDPERYGVIGFDDDGTINSIIEKPDKPLSNYAVTGLYFLDETAPSRAKLVKPSLRGELEITSLLQSYMRDDILAVEKFGRGIAWLDTGTHDSLMEAGQFIETIEKRQGLKVACLEEIAFRMNYIDAAQVKRLAEPLKKNGYGQYLLNIIKE